MLLWDSERSGIDLFVVELISKESKTTGHAESIYIRKGPCRKLTGLNATFQQVRSRIIRALAYYLDMQYSFRPLTDGSLGGKKVILVPVNSKLISLIIVEVLINYG